MHNKPRVFETAAAAGHTAATLSLDRLTRSSGNRFLLGCPSGRSLASTYAALGELAGEADTDLSHVVIVMMDDYVVRDTRGNLARVDGSLPYSCERFGRDSIVGVLNAAVSPAHRMPPDALWLPDPLDPPAYDEKISSAGGINLFLLASGTSDGHIAFNPPGSDRASKTRVLRLAESTRKDNLATFPAFGGNLTHVPSLGVTVGIDTICSLSASVLMMCHGAGKGKTVERITSADRYDERWPATILAECTDPHFFTDAAANDAALSIQATAAGE